MTDDPWGRIAVYLVRALIGMAAACWLLLIVVMCTAKTGRWDAAIGIGIWALFLTAAAASAHRSVGDWNG